MKRKNFIGLAIVFFAIGLMTAGCKTASVETKQMAGTMDEPVPSDMMPDSIQQATAKAMKYHCHELMNDSVNEVYVASIDEMDEISTVGYGIQVTKGAMSTTFPNIRNSREPQATYNA